jgi:hypothetical protein
MGLALALRCDESTKNAGSGFWERRLRVGFWWVNRVISGLPSGAVSRLSTGSTQEVSPFSRVYVRRID